MGMTTARALHLLVLLCLPIGTIVFDCASAETLGERATDAGCASTPVRVEGIMFKCLTRGGNTAYFSVPGYVSESPDTGAAKTRSPKNTVKADSPSAAQQPNSTLAATGTAFAVADHP